MRIPSPDDLLIAAGERLAAPLQDRGVSLAALRAPLPFAQPIGAFLLAGMVTAVGRGPEATGLAMLFAVIGVVEALTAVSESRALARDARAWGPSVAARYRSQAALARRTGGLHRMSSFVFTVVSAMLVGIAASTGLPIAILGSLGFLFWTGGRLAEGCAACVMPRDPDLLARNGLPSRA